jgi:uncharacterized pyridoxal phosphate-containing UPF0001 family protein
VAFLNEHRADAHVATVHLDGEGLVEVGEGEQRGEFGLDTLSLGMSDDLESAIAAGSTMVRIGTAIFGERRRVKDAA